MNIHIVHVTHATLKIRVRIVLAHDEVRTDLPQSLSELTGFAFAREGFVLAHGRATVFAHVFETVNSTESMFVVFYCSRVLVAPEYSILRYASYRTYRTKRKPQANGIPTKLLGHVHLRLPFY
jgi:hypothetical protein